MSEISELKKKLKEERRKCKTSEDVAKLNKKVNAAIDKCGGNWTCVYNFKK